jgi:uncharacterized lipoprotein YajG
MTPKLALLLLAVILGGCATQPHPNAIEVADPGRLPSAQQVVSISGLRPCNDGAVRM